MCIACIPMAQADTVALKQGHPQTYVVKKGDTLWDISATFLEDAWRWPSVWKFNPQIENPHLIYPGDVVQLTYVNGEPRLTIVSRDEKLSPKIRASAIAADVEKISLASISKYLSGNRIVELGELESAPYVVSGQEGRLIMGGSDTVYVRGELDQNNIVYGLYRKGGTYLDPKTGELLGREATQLGTGTVVGIDDGIASVFLERTSADVRIKDRLLPLMEQRIDSTIYPKPPSQPVEGVIAAVVGGVTQVGQYNVVVFNRGAREGIEPGNVLSIYKEGQLVADEIADRRIRLPAEKGGVILVYRVFEKMSYALVMEASRPLSVGDLVKSK
ncbi:MAG: LysM peptidoglycan-binding domain-containing protein [Pseudomonadales bacterium]|nr:LysM peptidoglycan-binding domain-containing protein [Pseudomonadales bacterium]